MTRLTAEDLLETARRLAPSNKEHPSEADLRRAISTAYYALFCALGDEVARPYDGHLNLTIRRLAAHGSAREVLARLATVDQTTGEHRLQWLPDQPACDQDLFEFSQSFSSLVEAREHADYDHLRSLSKADADAAIDRAERAVRQLRAARSRSPDQVQAVCVAIIAAPQARGRMKAQ